MIVFVIGGAGIVSKALVGDPSDADGKPGVRGALFIDVGPVA